MFDSKNKDFELEVASFRTAGTVNYVESPNL